MNLGCLRYKMTPEEVLTAVTLNAAAAINRANTIGSLEPGKKADLVIWDAPDLDYICYRMGSNLAGTVIKNGKVERGWLHGVLQMRKITEIAQKAGIEEKYLEQYGNYKAKVDPAILKDLEDRPNGKLILVTAITPTPAGEGKTTTSVGLTDGLRRIGKNAVVALREPSLGPVFGVKGGAAGGGYAQVVPMEDINLHFTGDFHAIGAANNLLAAMLDNHIQQGNPLGIDPKSITWKRAVDWAAGCRACPGRMALRSLSPARSWRCCAWQTVSWI